MKSINLILIILSLTFMTGCFESKKITELRGEIFGTYYRIILAGDMLSTEDYLKEKIEKRLKELDLIFSTYKSDSELNKLNALKKNQSLKVSNELFKVLLVSFMINRGSGGAFDPTVGPLVNAWGFGPNKVSKKPSDAKLRALKSNTGMHLVKIGKLNREISKKYESVKIDLSAVAKGYAIDEVYQLIHGVGYQNYLVEIGGEVRASGTKFGEFWKVGIEEPGELRGAVHKAIPLKPGMSIATSGSYRNYKKYGDTLFSHTIDPRTGYPVNHQLVSVSLVFENTTGADAWATALMTLGAQKGIELSEKLKMRSYFIIKRDNKLETLESSHFTKYLEK